MHMAQWDHGLGTRIDEFAHWNCSLGTRIKLAWFRLKYNLMQWQNTTKHPKFDLTGVQDHDLHMKDS